VHTIAGDSLRRRGDGKGSYRSSTHRNPREGRVEGFSELVVSDLIMLRFSLKQAQISSEEKKGEKKRGGNRANGHFIHRSGCEKKEGK